MLSTVLKNIGAVAGGFVLTFLLTWGMDTLLESTGVFPTIGEQKKYGFNVVWMNVLAIVYRFIFTVTGGYFTFRISATKPMRNVMILGIVGTVIALVANIAISQVPEMTHVLPVWFSVVLVVMAFPSVWLGGKLGAKRKTPKNH